MGARRTELRTAEGALMNMDLSDDLALSPADESLDLVTRFLNTCSETEIKQLLEINK